MTDFKSLARIGLYTFIGAFFAALTFVGIPSTLVEAKTILAPALGAAIAAEIVYLRKVFAKALADAAAGGLGPASSNGPTTTVTTATEVTSTPAKPPAAQ